MRSGSTESDRYQGIAGHQGAGSTAQASEIMQAKLKAAIAQQCGEQTQANERTPEIPRYIDEAFRRTEELSERLSMLEGRLSGVLTPRPPNEDGCKACAGTGIGQMLAELNARLSLLNDCAGSIYSRLEL